MDWEHFKPETYAGHDESFVATILPPRGFIREWVYYCASITDCHASYHVLNALSLLSTMMPVDAVLPDGSKMPANFFSLVVGPSQVSRKTTSVKLVGGALADVRPDLYMATPGSGEWLVDEVIASPRCLIVVEEGGVFFGQTAKAESYMDTLRARLIALSDASPAQRGTVSKVRAAKEGTRDKTAARAEAGKKEMKPRVSMTVAIAPPYLEDYTLLRDWTGGFVPRYCIAYGERQREYKDEARTPNKAWEAALRSHLARLSDIGAVGECRGLTQDARDYWSWWRENRWPKRTTEKSESLVERAQTHARKAALIAAYDEHVLAAVTDPVHHGSKVTEAWSIHQQHVVFGCAVAEMHIAGGLKLVASIAESPERRDMRRIERFVAERGGRAPKHEVYDHMGLLFDRTDRLIKSLTLMHRLDSQEEVVYSTTPTEVSAKRTAEIAAFGGPLNAPELAEPYNHPFRKH